MIEDSGLVDLGYYGHKYSWSNGRGPNTIVWKRLDRGLVNDQWLVAFPATNISYLASTGSDHNPLLIEINIRQEMGKRHFKFFNDWVDNKKCMPLVEEVWNREVTSNPMWIFPQKLKEHSNALSIWSRQEYGDISQKAKMFEQQVKDAEETWAQSNSENDRITFQKIKAQYLKYILKSQSSNRKLSYNGSKMGMQTPNTFTA
ncbi:uncharacterized protein LOC142169774 [Nicotiana tabacum]|uniref:Uncharacterized protein LOC142169774 n=1 Tax=Nicotiana tabacum TaxID=4097 RepID=A0AC58SS32_TOBAC